MQPLASDYRRIVRFEMVPPSDAEEHGDAVATYVRSDRVIQAGFVPMQSVRTPTETGTFTSETMFRVFVGGLAHPFKVGDRLGPATADAPDMEVVSAIDFPTIQNLEVRLLV